MNRFSLSRLVRGIVIVGALAISALTFAQRNMLNETAFGLSTPEMQADLGLTDSQKSDVDQIMRAYSREQQAAIARSKGEAGQAAIDQVDATFAQKLIKV